MSTTEGMPLTPFALTKTTLWVESKQDEGDYHPLAVDHGGVAVFHGSLCTVLLHHGFFHMP